MKISLLFLGFVGAVDNTPGYLKYLEGYNKNYQNATELLKRYTIFNDNKHQIDAHNKKLLPWKMGENTFTDLTSGEFADLYLGYRQSSNETDEPKDLYVGPTQRSALPNSLDWRTSGAVTSVKNQGRCGSCWTFAAIGSVEGAHKIKSGTLYDLSEQQILSCSGAGSCAGGYMNGAFKYMQQKGVSLETSNPYKGYQDSCKQVPMLVTVSKYTIIRQNDEVALMSALLLGPVSVAVDASHWQNYKSGVMNTNCGKSLNHGVLLVGFGTERNIPYWIVKNSWSPNWGEAGYIRLVRNINQCGIAMSAIVSSYVIVHQKCFLK